MKYTKEKCLELLVEKSNKIGGIPKKSDFLEEEIVAIKAFLGPWPRALEQAGLKPMRDVSRKELNREKRIRAKKKTNTIKKRKKKGYKK